MIDRLFGELGDRDGNFREQFQTSGFDARIWELCVYGLLVESGFHLQRDHATPDFVVNKDGVELALEVTTANLSAADDPSDFEPESEQEILLHTSERLPIKLGSPLFTKLNRRYWELEHVRGRPLLIAIESFAGGQSLWFADSSLASYLYGSRAIPWRLADGSLRVTTMPLAEHRIGRKRIPSSFFNQPETENISAIIFSNSGTIAKFNRMALQEGIERDAIVKMIRPDSLTTTIQTRPSPCHSLTVSTNIGRHGSRGRLSFTIPTRSIRCTSGSSPVHAITSRMVKRCTRTCHRFIHSPLGQPS